MTPPSDVPSPSSPTKTRRSARSRVRTILALGGLAALCLAVGLPILGGVAPALLPDRPGPASDLDPLRLTPVAARAGRSANASALYAQHCAACHGANLDGGMGGSLVDGEWKHGGTDADLRDAIREGHPDMGMEGWKDELSEEQVRALVIFIREAEKRAAERRATQPRPDRDRVIRTELHDYRVQTIIDAGLNIPWDLSFLPDGRMLICERPGQLRIASPDGKLQPRPVTGLPPVVHRGQGGLMVAEPHPDYTEPGNGWIYLGFATNAPAGGRGRACMTAIARGRITDDGRWTDNQWIYQPDRRWLSTSGRHFGTQIVFKNGYVYFPIGDRGSRQLAQRTDTPHGAMHRLHDDGRVPEDNPFTGKPDAIASIWSYGHRNPQGVAIDPRDGRIYATEHGPRGGDELNAIQKGANYGWPEVTHGMEYSGRPITDQTSAPRFQDPVIHWTPSIAPCGLTFYTGDRFPEWKNDLFAGALVEREIQRIRIVDGKVVQQETIMEGLGRVRAVVDGPDGALWVVLNDPDHIVRFTPLDE